MNHPAPLAPLLVWCRAGACRLSCFWKMIAEGRAPGLLWGMVRCLGFPGSPKFAKGKRQADRQEIFFDFGWMHGWTFGVCLFQID